MTPHHLGTPGRGRSAAPRGDLGEAAFKGQLSAGAGRTRLSRTTSRGGQIGEQRRRAPHRRRPRRRAPRSRRGRGRDRRGARPSIGGKPGGGLASAAALPAGAVRRASSRQAASPRARAERREEGGAGRRRAGRGGTRRTSSPARPRPQRPGWSCRSRRARARAGGACARRRPRSSWSARGTRRCSWRDRQLRRELGPEVTVARSSVSSLGCARRSPQGPRPRCVARSVAARLCLRGGACVHPKIYTYRDPGARKYAPTIDARGGGIAYRE